MPTPTHATIARFKVDLSREADQRDGLERIIVPGVREFAGVVEGTWTLDREAAESIVLITYESRAAAEQMRANIMGNADNQRFVGLDLVGVRIVEIMASATGA